MNRGPLVECNVLSVRSLPTFRRLQRTEDHYLAAAWLLYFDKVRIDMPFTAGDPTAVDPVQLEEEAARIVESRGPAAIDEFMTDGASDLLTVREELTLRGVRETRDFLPFMQEYVPLIAHRGPLTYSSMCRGLSGEYEGDELRLRLDYTLLDLATVAHDVLSTLSDLQASRLVANAIKSKRLDPLAVWWRDCALADWPEYLDATDLPAKQTIAALMFVQDVLFHKARMRQDVIPISDGQYSEAYADIDSAQTITGRAMESAVLAEVIGAVPALLPRSVEAIAELRQTMVDELAEMREGLAGAVHELRSIPTVVTREDIRRLAAVRFVNPLKRLRRRLSNPGRDVARELATTESVVLNGIGLSVAIFGGGPGSVFTPLLTSSVAVLVAAAKAQMQRASIIDDSGVKLLHKALERFRPK